MAGERFEPRTDLLMCSSGSGAAKPRSKCPASLSESKSPDSNHVPILNTPPPPVPQINPREKCVHRIASLPRPPKSKFNETSTPDHRLLLATFLPRARNGPIDRWESGCPLSFAFRPSLAAFLLSSLFPTLFYKEEPRKSSYGQMNHPKRSCRVKCTRRVSRTVLFCCVFEVINETRELLIVLQCIAKRNHRSESERNE